MDAPASLLNLASAASCIVTLYALYWMLIARTAGKEFRRSSVRVSLRSTTPLASPSASKRSGSIHGSPILPNMLRGAVQKYDKESTAAKATPADLLHSSPPIQETSQARAGSNVNPGYRNPLRPTSMFALNGRNNSQGQRGMHSGVKRTASGLAKALDGQFDDVLGTQHRPIVLGDETTEKRKILQVTQNDFIDENDFDSDIELDAVEPTIRKEPSYPRLKSTTSPSRPIVYPTLPRQQQAATSPNLDVDPGYATVGISPGNDGPKSSAPLPWSSSPTEHLAPRLSTSAIRSFTYNPTKTQHGQNGPPPPVPQQRPAKRRHLPWQDDEPEEAPSHPAASSTAAKSTNDATPLPQKSSKLLWNTSASAVKEQQKQHRQDNKKAIKKNEGDQVAVRAAKTSRDKQPPRVFLSEEQQHVLKLVTEDKMSVFFTGSAGTGKSVLMREIITTLRRKFSKEPDRVAVTASTGLAACNVGGVTLHSFAGIGLGKEEASELVRKIKRNQKAKHRWLRTKVLIVDEISMVDGDLFDKLESVARQIRNNGRPFGGIQLVVTGDFFQLPPVPEQGKSKFAFDAATWKTTIAHTIALHHVFRQKDPVFAGMLNEMREGRLQQSSINAFRNLSRPLGPMHDLEATELFPTRAEVENANLTRLRNLQGEDQFFEARDGGLITDKAQRDKLLANCMAPETITLKKGCQVMLIKNIDESLVNGSIGKVMGFMDERKFDNYTAMDSEEVGLSTDGTFASSGDDILANALGATKKKMLEPVITSSRRWPVVRFVIADGTSRDLLCQPESYKIELPNGEIQASRSQIPLILAWALSIHKAQGQTLERVKVDLGKVFEKGQAYVALSRATNMAGLQVLRFDPNKVVAHEKVRHFYAQLSTIEMMEKNASKKEAVKSRTGAGMGANEYERMFVEDL